MSLFRSQKAEESLLCVLLLAVTGFDLAICFSYNYNLPYWLILIIECHDAISLVSALSKMKTGAEILAPVLCNMLFFTLPMPRRCGRRHGRCSAPAGCCSPGCLRRSAPPPGPAGRGWSPCRGRPALCTPAGPARWRAHHDGEHRYGNGLCHRPAPRGAHCDGGRAVRVYLNDQRYVLASAQKRQGMTRKGYGNDYGTYL